MGNYQEIIAGADCFFTADCSAAVTTLSANLTSATYSFLVKERPDIDTDSQAIISLTNTSGTNGVVTMDTGTKIATVTINAAATADMGYPLYPLLWWQLRTTLATGKKYILDQGKLGIVAFGGFGAGSGLANDADTSVSTSSAKWDASIETVADLAAIPTVDMTVPVIRGWIMTATGVEQVWRLLAGTDATVSGSVQRPDDYNAITNAKVWYKVSS